VSSTRKTSNISFVNLHGHSCFSVFDGLGYPEDHMEFAYQNGCDALALTDHGNMNGLSHQVLHAMKMEAEGKEFKPIYGIEAYFIDSVSKWREEYEEVRKISQFMVLKRTLLIAFQSGEKSTKRSVRPKRTRRKKICLCQLKMKRQPRNRRRIS